MKRLRQGSAGVRGSGAWAAGQKTWFLVLLCGSETLTGAARTSGPASVAWEGWYLHGPAHGDTARVHRTLLGGAAELRHLTGPHASWA